MLIKKEAQTGKAPHLTGGSLPESDPKGDKDKKDKKDKEDEMKIRDKHRAQLRDFIKKHPEV